MCVEQEQAVVGAVRVVGRVRVRDSVACVCPTAMGREEHPVRDRSLRNTQDARSTAPAGRGHAAGPASVGAQEMRGRTGRQDQRVSSHQLPGEKRCQFFVYASTSAALFCC